MTTEPTELVEGVLRALIEAVERLPGTRMPAIAAEDLAGAALDAMTWVGFELCPLPPEDGLPLAA